jgi:hypothetical protein
MKGMGVSFRDDQLWMRQPDVGGDHRISLREHGGNYTSV